MLTSNKFSMAIVCILSLFFLQGADSTSTQVDEMSLSLNVHDVAASKLFYEKLGFKQDEKLGGIEQRFVMMRQGQYSIGLFEGYFPKNTITFTSKDLRFFHDQLTNQGIEILFSTGLDIDHGPCSFSCADPDGNPILFDQR